eukprot:Skav210702  [mRNA]  locus=scaffold1240:114420:114971:- [translate_table: standard]
MVLDYVQPLKHLDQQLEALTCELMSEASDWRHERLPGFACSQTDPVDAGQLRQKWRSEGLGDSPLASVLRSPQFLAMDISMDAMRPQESHEQPLQQYCRSFTEDADSTLPLPDFHSPSSLPGQITRAKLPGASYTHSLGFSESEQLLGKSQEYHWSLEKKISLAQRSEFYEPHSKTEKISESN